MFVLCLCESAAFLLHSLVGCTFYTHTSDILQYLSFSIWLISRSIMCSKSIRVVQMAKFQSFFFLWLSSISLYMNSPGKNTGVGCHPLFQGIVQSQGLNLGLLHCRQILHHLSHFQMTICKPHLLYPFICWWTLGLLPNLGYSKWCCCEHWGACIFSN